MRHFMLALILLPLVAACGSTSSAQTPLLQPAAAEPTTVPRATPAPLPTISNAPSPTSVLDPVATGATITLNPPAGSVGGSGDEGLAAIRSKLSLTARSAFDRSVQRAPSRDLTITHWFAGVDDGSLLMIGYAHNAPAATLEDVQRQLTSALRRAADDVQAEISGEGSEGMLTVSGRLRADPSVSQLYMVRIIDGVTYFGIGTCTSTALADRSPAWRESMASLSRA